MSTGRMLEPGTARHNEKLQSDASPSQCRLQGGSKLVTANCSLYDPCNTASCVMRCIESCAQRTTLLVPNSAISDEVVTNVVDHVQIGLVNCQLQSYRQCKLCMHIAYMCTLLSVDQNGFRQVTDSNRTVLPNRTPSSTCVTRNNSCMTAMATKC